MRCPKCGARVADGTPVCPRCGTRLVVRTAARTATGAAGTTARTPRHAATASGQAPRKGASPTPHVHRHGRNRNRHIFTAAVLGVAALAVVGYLAWDVWFRPYNINAKDFPSDAVRTAVAAYDADGSNTISRDEAARVTDLTITSGSSVYGLSIFPNLQTLTIDSGDVTSVDVSKAENLKTLAVKSGESLSSVSFGDNAALSDVEVANTALTSLDLSGAPQVSKVDASYTDLSSLDISGLGALADLNVTGTKLSSLDLSSAGSLALLRCDATVRVDNVPADLNEYWALTSFQNNVPAYAGNAAQKVTLDATYDDRDRLASITYANAEDGSEQDPATISYEYDDASRVVKATFSNLAQEDGSDAPADIEWTISYGDDGRMTEASSTAGLEYTYAYNDDGQLETCTVVQDDGAPTVYAFSYDDAGRVTSMKVGEGEETSYSYDSNGRLVKAVTKAAGKDADEESDSASSEKSDDSASSSASAASTSSSSSSDSSSSSSTSGSASGSDGDTQDDALETYTFGYDGNGNCTAYVFNSQEYPIGQFNEVYTRASNGRLTNATRKSDTSTAAWLAAHHGISSAEYHYDSAGNLTSGALTRTEKADGDHETFAIGYQRVLATEELAPRSIVTGTTYPLASMVDNGESLADAASSGQSVFTPWAVLPTPESMVFMLASALFGLGIK